MTYLNLQYFKNKAKETVVKNSFFLIASQISVSLSQLIIVPYIVRIIGVKYFGVIAFINTIIFFLNFMLDSCLNISFVRKISNIKGNLAELSSYFFNMIYFKLVFGLVLFFVFFLFSVMFSEIYYYKEMYLFGFVFIFGNILNPIWFFQGVENVKFISISNIISKIFYVLLIFVLLNKKEDYYLIIYINALLALIVGIMGFIYAIKIFNIKISDFKLSKFLELIKEGKTIFFSNIATTFYSYLTTIILGVVVSYESVGYFNAADKLIKAVRSLIAPIYQVIFPYFTKAASEGKERFKYIFTKTLTFLGSLTLIISLLLIVFSNKLIILIYGQSFVEAVPVLQIMAATIFFVSINNTLGVQTLLNYYMDGYFFRVLLVSGIFNIIMLLFLTQFLTHIGAAISVSLTELLIIILFAYVIKIKKVLLND
ncbi:MAG: oligosaccharide flippase family protein [bacterium]